MVMRDGKRPGVPQENVPQEKEAAHLVVTFSRCKAHQRHTLQSVLCAVCVCVCVCVCAREQVSVCMCVYGCVRAPGESHEEGAHTDRAEGGKTRLIRLRVGGLVLAGSQWMRPS